MNNNQIRHRSPKTQNNFFNNYYLKSPPKKDINIINFNNSSGINYNYNNTNDYYEEITKAFNFITFILKKKDTQIKELKIKIKELEKQLNDINETNIMTFNNKDIGEIYSDQEKNKNKTNLKRITYHYIPNKSSIFYSNNNNNNNINDKKTNENTSKIFSNNINFINRVKNSTNINKINNYRNNIDLNNNKYNYMNYTNINNTNNTDYLNTEENVNKKIDLNKNINEYSNEKKNINIIRKEPYHSNLNNIKYRNSSGNKNRILQMNETDTSTGNDKIKIFNLNMGGRTNSKNSKNNSISLSDEGFLQSKEEIKNYLKEVKNKIDKDKFQKFVNLIKNLIKNKNNSQKNMIVYEIKNILVDKNLINKFETILKIK